MLHQHWVNAPVNDDLCQLGLASSSLTEYYVGVAPTLSHQQCGAGMELDSVSANKISEKGFAQL